MPDMASRIRDMNRPSTVVTESDSAIQAIPNKGSRAKSTEMISIMVFAVLVVIFVLMGPETKGKHLTSDLEVFVAADD